MSRAKMLPDADNEGLSHNNAPPSPAPEEASSATTSESVSEETSEAALETASQAESEDDSNADSDAEYLSERFGSLLFIGEASLEALAHRIRKSARGETYLGLCQLAPRLNGSYNLVHVVEFADDIKYVIRVPLTAQEGRFDEQARAELRVHALTLRYIKRKTGIPVPDVFDFDTTNQNEIGAPYIAMSYLEETRVSEKWFCRDSVLSELRKRTLDTVAEAMCKLRDLEFSAIGSLQFSSENLEDFEIGPCYGWDEGNPDDENYGLATVIKQSGPFISSRHYLRSFIENDFFAEKDLPVITGSRMLISWMINYLPLSISTSDAANRETFVLGPPDYDSQNFLVDDDGNLTGILDWDTVGTLPRYIGYSCYPGWITRDWDPLMYGHPSETENTPEQLEQFREQWDNKMRELLGGKGDYKFTTKSHLFFNVAVAAQNPYCRNDIVCKILSVIFPEEDDVYCDHLVQSVGQGDVDPEVEKRVRDGLQQLFRV